jgi:muconate cycloisomerase
LGEEPLLYIDANQGYSPSTAAFVVKQCLEYGVNIIEEPIRKELYAARRDFKLRYLNGCSEVQVLGDDSVYSSFDVMRELEERSIDMISLKAARTGVTESRKIVVLAEQFGAGVLIGTQGDSAIGTMLSAHIAMGLGVLQYPAEQSFFTILPDDLLVKPPVIKEGRLFIPSLPGSGIELNKEAFARYRQDQ